MNIYVGNLAWEVTDKDLENLFGYFGTVTSAVVITDNKSGKSKGFGFVEMADEAQGTVAVEKLNNTEFKERKLIVNEARPKS